MSKMFCWFYDMFVNLRKDFSNPFTPGIVEISYLSLCKLCGDVKLLRT